MKVRFFFFLALVYSVSFGQNREYSFDYLVKYEVPSQKQESKDSLTIAYNKDGKYLWSDADFVAKSFGQGLVGGNPALINSTLSNIIFDLETADFTVGLQTENIDMMLRMNAKQFMHKDQLSQMEEIGLDISSTGQIKEILGKEYPVYRIAPSNSINNFFLITIDTSTEINSKAILQYIIEMVAGRELTEPLAKDLPLGLILNIEQNGKVLINAYEVKKEKKTILYNYYIGEKQ